jgi:hypothetical protein
MCARSTKSVLAHVCRTSPAALTDGMHDKAPGRLELTVKRLLFRSTWGFRVAERGGRRCESESSAVVRRGS